MRVIKIELPATLSSSDPNFSLASDEIRAQLFRELRALDNELNETVRQRAKSYFPEEYSVFVRTILAPDRLGTTTELWVVDPNIRWPAGLLTRRAWALFTPILAHVVRDAMTSRFEGVVFDMREDQAKVTVLAPTRAWQDPLVVAIFMFVLATAFWLYLYPTLVPSLGSLVAH
jgi:hypothetical protein